MKLEELRSISAIFAESETQDREALLRQELCRLGLDPDRLYQELEMSTRFAQAHQDTSFSNSVLHLHSHTFYEILCCRNNCGAEYLVGAERYRLQKGDIILIPPGVSHRPLLPESMEEPYIRDVLWINGDFFHQLWQTFYNRQPRENYSGLLRTAGTRWAYLETALRSIVREAEQQAEGWDMAVTGSAVTFLSHLRRALENEDAAAITAEEPDLLERLMAYIERNLAKRITLEDTARHFYVSGSTVGQLFRKKMGVSFYRCVTQRRLIAAKLLIAQQVQLEEVAERTGFTDYSAFYRAFRREYGISPRQYRQLP